MLQISSRLYLFLLLIILLGCDRGGNILMVGSIKGPDEVSEGTTVEFSVEAVGDTGITFNWVVNPVGFGTLDTPIAASTTFTAPEVESELEIVIRVVVNSDNDGPVVRSLDVTVRDIAGPTDPDDPDDPPVNHPPMAGAYVTTSVVEQDIEIQFFDDSTDPNGNDDIVTWEWDFTYDPDDGFQIDSTEKGPVQASTIEGVFLVQHRVEDSGGLSDLLDEPLVIIVELGPKAPVAAAHVDDYEISAGDFLQFFDDSTDPNGQEDIVLWEWDFSFDPDDGFNVESTEIEPLVEFSQVGIFDVQFRVTDSTDLSDMLDEPLLITVIHDHPAASYGFTFGDDLNNDEAIGIGVDPEGRVYVTGDFVNTVDFDPSEDVHEMTAIRRSGYVVKYDQADFQVLDSAQWDGTYSYNEYQADVDSFSSDGNGNFYITGTCQHNPVTPRATYIRSITPSNLNNWVAYEKNWYYLNWFLWHEASCEYDYSPVACGNDGNIFYFVNTICKGETWYYSPEGSYLNATLLKRTPSGIEEVFLELDPYEFINTFNSVEVNQHGVFTFVHNWSDESFIRHFSLDGSLQWELGFGPQENIQYTMAESDDAGNVYFTGFNDNTLTKISPDGEILLELSWDASAEDIYIHPDGSFLVTGTFTGTVDFDPGSDVKLRSSAGTTSGYVSAFDPDGNFLWVETWGDSEEMYAKSLTTDDSGIIYVCGYFSGSIDLGPPWQSDIHYSNGWTDAFVLKLSQ